MLGSGGACGDAFAIDDGLAAAVLTAGQGSYDGSARLYDGCELLHD